MHLLLLPAILFPLGVTPTAGIAMENPPSVRNEWEVDRIAGTVRGRVTEEGSGQPVVGATVVVANTRLGAVTGDDGRYTVTQVPAGRQSITVRMLGYAPKTAAVTVTDNGEAVADFSLERSASQLSQVVVTATGDQRRVEIGNAVATLRADSLMIAAPITSLGDMLQGRVAGLMTFANAGMTGSAPRVRIRGFNSLSQPNNPLLIIDGARVDNTTGAGSGGGTNIQSYGWTSGSMTSINPEEIESMEIVKGPAAATLYGTDAANGVIVIRTKRGVAGEPRWNFYGEGGLIPGPTKWNENYYAFGKNTAGQQVNCVNLARAAGQCTVDSVSQWNPMADAISSPVGTGYRRQIGAQVSGGAQQFRYFVGSDWEREQGYLRLPESEIERLKLERGGAEIPDEQIHPNYLNRAALRANASAMLGAKSDLNLSNSLQFQRSQIPTNTVFTDAAWGRGFNDGFDGWLNQRRPGESFATRAAERLVRLTSSANGNFTPVPWLLSRATVGVDVSSNFSDNLQRRGEGGTAPAPSLGRRLDSRSSTILFTGDLGASATFNLTPALVSKTSVGAQYNRRGRGITTAIGTNLPPGSSTLAGAATVTNSEATIQSVVAGAYVEQQFALNDRLFVTGAMRADGASTFGENFTTAYYPKASISWLTSSEDWFPKSNVISSFRFRTAYGSSGVQPPADAALTRLQLATVFVNGSSASGAQLQTLGNPNLAPERTTELEAGVDIEFFNGRVSLEATAYEKKSKDALVQRSYPRSAGLIATGQLDNVGRVRNRGFEAILNTPHRGRVYLAWNDVYDSFVRDQYAMFLQYSDDNGKTFSDPMLIDLRSGGKLVATEPVVLSDGTVLVTYYQYWNPLGDPRNEKLPMFVRRSTDGAKTFSPAEQVFDFGPHIWPARRGEFPAAFSLPIVVADTSSASPYRDHMYATWDDTRSGQSDIWFTRSSDKGRTWSAPLRVNDNARTSPLGVADFRMTPVVAVAPKGEIAIAWYDRRADPARRCWDYMLAVSNDGGRRFGTNHTVTTAPSCPPPGQGPTAYVHNLSTFDDPNRPPDSTVARLSTMERFALAGPDFVRSARDEANKQLTNGRLLVSFDGTRNVFAGHYTGLAADRNGAFTAVWADRRNGRQELFTARVALGAPTPPPANLREVDVTNRVEVITGTPRYDAAKSTVHIQLQLRNVSGETIFGPLQLDIVNIASAGGQPTAELVDSAGVALPSTVVSFAGKAGAADRLERREISEAVEVVLKLRPGAGFDTALDFRVRGRAAR